MDSLDISLFGIFTVVFLIIELITIGGMIPIAVWFIYIYRARGKILIRAYIIASLIETAIWFILYFTIAILNIITIVDNIMACFIILQEGSLRKNLFEIGVFTSLFYFAIGVLIFIPISLEYISLDIFGLIMELMISGGILMGCALVYGLIYIVGGILFINKFSEVFDVEILSNTFNNIG